MKIVAVICALTMAACAPEVVYKPVNVEVPVSVPCRVNDVPPPAWATNGIKATDASFVQAQALGVADKQHQAYEAQLLAAVKSCQ